MRRPHLSLPWGRNERLLWSGPWLACAGPGNPGKPASSRHPFGPAPSRRSIVSDTLNDRANRLESAGVLQSDGTDRTPFERLDQSKCAALQSDAAAFDLG